jgi:hypothetical protein
MPWNANLQIVQGKAYVMIMTEMNHDARIIKLLGNHDNSDFNSWMGDSIGFWEDETLVVHTINFRSEQSKFLMAMSEQFELTERFKRVSETEILYRYTVNDPLVYTEPFTGEGTITLRKPDQLIFEVACQEGTYSMVGVLAGARSLESREREREKTKVAQVSDE